MNNRVDTTNKAREQICRCAMRAFYNKHKNGWPDGYLNNVCPISDTDVAYLIALPTCEELCGRFINGLIEREELTTVVRCPCHVYGDGAMKLLGEGLVVTGLVA